MKGIITTIYYYALEKFLLNKEINANFHTQTCGVTDVSPCKS